MQMNATKSVALKLIFVLIHCFGLDKTSQNMALKSMFVCDTICRLLLENITWLWI